MPILTSRTRVEDDSVTTTIPAEAARRMGVSPGDELCWVEDGMGGYHVSACNPSRVAALRAHAEIMDEYGDAFSYQIGRMTVHSESPVPKCLTRGQRRKRLKDRRFSVDPVDSV